MRLLANFFLFSVVSVWAFPKLLPDCSVHQTCASCANATFPTGGKCEWCIKDATCRPYGLNLCPISYRIPHPYNCPGKIANDIYDEDLTRDVHLPLIAAAHATDKENLTGLLTDCFHNVELINNYYVICDPTNLTYCHAFLAYLKDYNAVVLSFRGTIGYYQLIDEGISFFLAKKVPHKITGGNVDPYYLNSFNAIWENGLKKDFENLMHRYPAAEIWSVGHSMGGGLASLAATQISYDYKLKDRLKLISFGQPRIGDIQFAIGHDKLVPNSIRVINRFDPIPSIPPRSFLNNARSGSFHHKYEIWYPFNMMTGPYVIGRNADAFSIETSLLHVTDHFRYFDVRLQDFPEEGCRVKMPIREL